MHSEKKSKILRIIIGTLFFIVGLGMLILVVFIFISKKDFEANKVQTTAIVVGNETEVRKRSRKISRDNTIAYKPIINFKDQNNKTYQELLKTTKYYDTPFIEGSKLQIYYDQRNPKNTEIVEEKNSYWLPILIFILIGLPFTLAGLAVLVSTLRTKEKTKISKETAPK